MLNTHSRIHVWVLNQSQMPVQIEKSDVNSMQGACILLETVVPVYGPKTIVSHT